MKVTLRNIVDTMLKHKLLLVFVAVSLLSTLPSNAAFADMSTNSRLANGDAWRYCNNGTEWAKGMVWLSNQSDYYSERTNIGQNDTSVRVSIRGAVNTCRTSFGAATNMNAINVSASRELSLDTNRFFRGVVPGNRTFAWSSQGGHLWSTLDVSGVATCDPSNTTGVASATMWISLTRTMEQTRDNSGYYYSSNPATERVPIDVYRTCPVYTYTLTPSITSPDNGTVVESDKGPVTVQGNVANAGPTSSRSTEWRITELKYRNTMALNNIPQKDGSPDSGQDPCDYFTGETDCNNNLNSGNQTYPTSGGNHSANATIGADEIGTKICYALSVKPFNQDTSNWRHSALKCYVIGKKPKVQVWGGDLIVGRGLEAGGTKRISNVSTSTTTIQAQSDIVTPAPAGTIRGLWNTGVDDSGRKLTTNAFDPHWQLTQVYRPAGYGEPTCQRIDTGTWNDATKQWNIDLKSLSTKGSNAARVITEGYTGGQLRAGQYTNDTARIGNGPQHGVPGEYVWARTSPSAAWIGQNFYGRNFSDPSCVDPTDSNGKVAIGDSSLVGKSDDDLMASANIYIFKLKNGFTIPSESRLDLSSVKITIRGASDNHLKFVVNGKDASDWQRLSWTDFDSTASANITGSTLHYDTPNTLEVHVRTTFPLTGLLIDDIKVEANTRTPVGNIFGSWSEYATVPSGIVTGFSSASGYAQATKSDQLCPLSLLTFANGRTAGGCDAARIGSYRINSSSPAQAIANRFTPTQGVPAVSGTARIQNLESRKVTPGTGTNLTVRSSGDVPKGKWVVLNAPESTVTIADNINYTNASLTNVDEIPQVVIIARNIIIGAGVTNVDAWLVTTGTGDQGYLKTCDSTGDITGTPTDLRTGMCGDILRINGPVVVNRLLMYRTGGANEGARSGEPAEIFNLRPDAYLWASNVQTGSGKARTVQTVELPPRF